MLRSLAVLAFIVSTVAATTASTTVSCQSTSVTVTGVCSAASGSYSVCTTSATAAAAALAGSVTTLNGYTASTFTTWGAATCSAFANSSTANADWWGTTSRWCKIDSTCDSTCGSTATQAVVTPAPGAPTAYCCSYYRSLISAACNGISVDTAVTPATSGALSWVGPLALVSRGAGSAIAFGACAESNCISGASTVAYSVLSMLVAALLALFL